jgi:hypothetical protein
MSTKPLHDFTPIPPGKTVGDVLPAWSAVKEEIHIGPPQKVCGACRKPFTVIRKPRKQLMVYPMHVMVPIRVDVKICGACIALHHQGGAARDGVLAGVQAFLEGEEAAQ